MKRVLRALAWLHRWLGAALCVPFLIWFLSGIPLLFSGFPGISDGERLQRSPPLPLSGVAISLEQATARLDFEPHGARLVMLGDTPVWRLEGESTRAVFNAETGERIATLTEAEAVRVAQRFLDSSSAPACLERRLEPDQWTPLAARRGQLPLLKLCADDAERSEVYVSLERAEIVQHTTRASRTLAWIGAIPHWWYPVQLRQHGAEWRMVVLIGSGIGTGVCLAGIVLGLVYIRRRPAAHGSKRWSPYAEGWLRYHHLVGLAFGVLTCTWVFSGMLSLNPGRWSPGSSPTSREDEAFHARPPGPLRVALPARAALERCASEISVKALELAHMAGRTYWLCRAAWNESRIIAADATSAPLERELSRELVEKAAAAAMGTPPLAIERLEAGDDYVYPTHLDPELRLPVWRLEFDGGKSLYVDAHIGEITARHESLSRLERWLYQGLHRLDFAPLYRTPWLWRTVVTLLCLAGAGFSLTGVVISWRVLRRQRRRRTPTTNAPARA